MSARTLFVIVLLAGVTASCTDTAPEIETQDEIPADTTSLDATAAGATLQVYEKQPYGTYLVDGENMSLYLFKADTQNADSSMCYDACAGAWPPFVSQAEPEAAAPAVDASMIGTIERRDGSMQVTYNGWPLYYFARDSAPGDTEGQDVMGFGAEWYLVSPAGAEVHAEEGAE